MTKPFQPLELVARVKAQLRRYKRYNAGPEHDSEIIVLSGLSLDIKSHTCTLNEHPLSLTPTEFSIRRFYVKIKGGWSVRRNCSARFGKTSIIQK